jgi:hypothetical protein
LNLSSPIKPFASCSDIFVIPHIILGFHQSIVADVLMPLNALVDGVNDENLYDYMRSLVVRRMVRFWNGK